MRALMLFALLAGGALADGVLVLDEAMLLSMARTREPDVRIVYAMDKLEFRTRRSALVGWIDVALTARFARVGRNIQLAAGSLHTGPFAQKGKRHCLCKLRINFFIGFFIKCLI